MSDRKSILFLLLACIMLIPMVSNDSFWIDEGGTVRFTMQETWASFGQRLLSYTGSEPQMPLYMALSKIWYFCVGKSEFLLRSMNIVFGIGFLVVGYLMARRFAWKFFPLFVVMQPFVWFYMNEFRPYILQMFAGALCLFGLQLLDDDKKQRWIFWFCGGVLLLVASSLLACIPVFLLALYALYMTLSRKLYRQFVATHWFTLLGSGIVAGGLVFFYLYKLTQGGGGSKVWNVSVANIAFSTYEMLGCSGLGFGRDALRDVVRSGFSIEPGDFSYVLMPLLLLLCFASIVLYYLLSFKKRKPDGSFPLFRLVSYLAAGFIMLYLLAVVFKWPFWGRHLAPFAIALYLVVYHLLRTVYFRSRVGTVLVVFFIILLCGSSLSLRICSRHKKTNYRTACRYAREWVNSGKVVWFVGSDTTFKFYDLEHKYGVLLDGLYTVDGSTKELSALPKPDVILYTKPDLFDPSSQVLDYCKQHLFERQVFACQGFDLLVATAR